MPSYDDGGLVHPGDEVHINSELTTGTVTDIVGPAYVKVRRDDTGDVEQFTVGELEPQ